MKDRFNTRPPCDWGQEESIADEIKRVADALWMHRVKLGATLARMRVRACAQHISLLIPESTRESFMEATSEPFYARVNGSKLAVSQSELMSRLHSSGFSIATRPEQLSSHKSSFLLRGDLLTFSPDCRNFLWGHDLVEEGLIIPQVQVVQCTSYNVVDMNPPLPQDPASYYCVSGLHTLFKADEECFDVLVTNCDSGGQDCLTLPLSCINNIIQLVCHTEVLTVYRDQYLSYTG